MPTPPPPSRLVMRCPQCLHPMSATTGPALAAASNDHQIAMHVTRVQ